LIILDTSGVYAFKDESADEHPAVRRATRLLAAWNAETPVPEEVRQQVQDELDRTGLTGQPGRDDRLAG
jgi:hypothetical protein